MSKARQVFVDDDPDYTDEPEYEDPEESYTEVTPRVGRVNVRPSPQFKTFYGHCPLTITLDTGAETNLIRESVVTSMRCPISPSTQVAYQADGSTPLKVKGETHITLIRDGLELSFSGLLVDSLDVDVLAGIPFMEENDVAVRPSKKLITVGDSHQFTYSSTTPTYSANHRSSVLRTTSKATVWPGEYLEIQLNADPDSLVAIEPHLPERDHQWPDPDIYSVVGGCIRILNTTREPQTVAKHAHIGHISAVFHPPINPSPDLCDPQAPPCQKPPSIKTTKLGSFHSDPVTINPDSIFTSDISPLFHTLNREFDRVFDPDYGIYNQSLGFFEAVVNMGSVKPPQRKGRLPQYSRNKLTELQAEIDRLEELGVFSKPEAIGVTVEYLNPSFLTKKANGGFRLVTAFTEVGKYCKPQPSLMPDVDSTLRSIARWKHIIKTDLTSAFYQIPLTKSSMKYCGIATPFKGIRVYTRCAMGMPGSETALEELMSRIVGDLIEDGSVAKNADDLYVGGDSPQALLNNWKTLLTRLDEANIKLSARKTVIAPKQTTVLGWIWNCGTLKADPDKLSALSTCDQPSTTKGLRSYIGAYKVLSRVIPNCASFLQPLDRATHGKKSADKIEWDDHTRDAFKSAQSHLTTSKSITIPKEDDQLWLVTDGASSIGGMGATLYVIRDGILKLAGFFSQQLTPTHLKWFPCEIEGITIAAAIQYFNGYIIQSKLRTQVLTDSKPCVDAYQKLLRGQFSSNVRLSTYLSAASRHHVSIQHLSGTSNLPSDFQSRHPTICHEPKCQVCTFSRALDDSIVRSVTVKDILDGSAHIPFASRKAWIDTQHECRDLRRTRAQLLQGTRPTKKETTIRSIKRYLNTVEIAHDGLIVVKHPSKLSQVKELIVVPETVLPGLLTALHLRLNHPSTTELTKAVKRYFWAIGLDNCIQSISSNCHQCASLKKVPHALIPQNCSEPPECIGVHFSADVLLRERQKVLVIREQASSFTKAITIPSEKHNDLRDALILLISDLVPLEGPPAVVRTDPAPGFKSLINDDLLRRYRITLQIGRIKAPNKNPVAEKAIQELEEEINRTTKSDEVLTPIALKTAITQLNSRIRTDGLSSREILFQRDQFTNTQIPVSDKDLISAKYQRALTNHRHSEKSKAHGAPSRVPEDIKPGDLVYVYSDRNKHAPRDWYLVTSNDGEWCLIKKFVGNTLRAMNYKVKPTEIYKVPGDPYVTTNSTRRKEADPDECTEYDEQLPDATTAPELEELPEHAPEPVTDDPTDLPEPDMAPPVEIAAPPVQPEDPHNNLPELDQIPVTASSYPAPEIDAAPTPRPVRTRKQPSRYRDYVL